VMTSLPSQTGDRQSACPNFIDPRYLRHDWPNSQRPSSNSGECIRIVTPVRIHFLTCPSASKTEEHTKISNRVSKTRVLRDRLYSGVTAALKI
jgi:hypothetical protein